MIRLKQLRQAGDTMVEIMIALAVVSLLIGGAMASSRESLRSTQRAAERSEAQKIAESQVEQLRARGFTNIGTATNFHFSSTGAQTNGAGTVSGTGINFTVIITRASATDHVFTVTSSWVPAAGGTDSVTYRYEVY